MHLASIFPQNIGLVPLDGAALVFLRFISSFGIFGALGFHYLVLGRTKRSLGPSLSAGPLADTFDRADRGAAMAGIAGALLFLVYLSGLAWRDAQRGQAGLLDAAARWGPQVSLPLAFAVILVAAFACALRRASWGWGGAAFIGTALALRKAIFGLRWAGLINPLHEISASLWLGTLCVLVFAGLPAILLGAAPRERRGPLVAEFVARFSPLALGAAVSVGVTGLITSWIRLKYLSALWTTTVGYVLAAKLGVVLVVVLLGAWNWRRVIPKLGTEAAAHTLRRSSSIELGFALVVLLLTAVLVVLPS